MAVFNRNSPDESNPILPIRPKDHSFCLARLTVSIARYVRLVITMPIDIINVVTHGSNLVTPTWMSARLGARRAMDAVRLRVAVQPARLAGASTRQPPLA